MPQLLPGEAGVLPRMPRRTERMLSRLHEYEYESSSRPDERERNTHDFPKSRRPPPRNKRDAKAKLCSRSQLPRLVSRWPRRRCFHGPRASPVRRSCPSRLFPRRLSLLQRTRHQPGLSALGCTSAGCWRCVRPRFWRGEEIAERRADPANASRLGFTAEEVENMEEMARLATRVI